MQPGAVFGIGTNETEIETRLRQRFVDKAILREHPTLQVYKAYYKAFEKPTTCKPSSNP